MSKPFSEVLNEDRRLVVLRVMAEQLGYKANSSVLANALDAFGHVVSRDYVRTQLAWLAEQGLVTTEEIVPGVVIAILTPRGMEVAQGRAVVPGVKRPGA